MLCIGVHKIVILNLIRNLNNRIGIILRRLASEIVDSKKFFIKYREPVYEVNIF
jgi:hypothetical protein